MTSRLARYLFAAIFACATLTAASTEAGRPRLRVVIHGVRPKLALNDSVKLTGRVTWTGPRAKFQYEWRSLSGPPLPVHLDTSTNKLAISKEDLYQGAVYRLQLWVVADYVDPDADPPEQRAEASSEVQFEINTPPRDGSCTLSVDWVGPNSARALVAAPGWVDDEQIQYRYVLLRNGKQAAVEKWSLAKRKTLATVARSGDTLQARCEVRDKLGDGTSAMSDTTRRP